MKTLLISALLMIFAPSPAVPQQASSSGATLKSLEALFPEKIGAFTAMEAMREMTGPMTAARRQYKDGQRQMTVDIIDSTSMSAMAAPIRAQLAARGGTPQQSADSMVKIVTIGKQSGILRWTKAQNSSQLEMLIDDRFVVRLLVFPASDPEEAITLAKSLDWK